MYIGIFPGDVPFTRTQHITITNLVTNDSNLKYEHVVQLTQALTDTSAPIHTPDIPTNIRS